MSANFFKIRNGLSLGSLTSDPSPSVNGDIYYNSTSNIFRKYENGAWVDFSTAGTVSEWNSYTPTFTGMGTVGTTDFKWRRVGSSIQINGIVLIGTPSGSVAPLISMPTGYTISSTQLNSSNLYQLGRMIDASSSTGQLVNSTDIGVVTNNGNDASNMLLAWRQSSNAFLADVASTFLTSGQLVTVDIEVIGASLTAAFSSNSGSVPITTKTTTYSLANTDGVILVDTSGGAWTLTIPSASSDNMNKIFRIKKITTEFNTLTISGGLTDRLDTIGECLEIMNDGTTWSVVSRTGLNARVSTSVVRISGSSSNPTKGTVTQDTATWYRNGSKLKCIYSFRQQGAGSNGSGTYVLDAVPNGSGLTVDTTYITAGDATGDIMIGVCGDGYLRFSSTWEQMTAFYMVSNSVSGIQLGKDGATSWNPGEGGLGSNVNVDSSASWEVPITGWKDY